MIGGARLEHLAGTLIDVPGVQAVVLGGSRARGTHHAGSDVDLGLYYSGDLDLAGLQRWATSVDDSHEARVAQPGAWGPWVNGGSWLTVEGTRLDLILRDLVTVRLQCQRARQGQFAFHVQAGHPLGFLDVSYAGEVVIGRILRDPTQIIAALKRSLTPYPEALRRALIEHFLWQADFLQAAAVKGLPKGDVAYVSLCCTTALMLCAHAWHAAAGAWVTNEKGLVPGTATLPLATRDFSHRAAVALGHLADGKGGPARAVETTAMLLQEARRELGLGFESGDGDG